MRAELIPFETEDFGQTGLHLNDRVMRLKTPEGEDVLMRMTAGSPSIMYLNETVIWVAGHMRWTFTIEEYNALTQATDRMIGIGRANTAETLGPDAIRVDLPGEDLQG